MNQILPSNYQIRDILTRSYGWKPMNIIWSSPHALFLGGVDPYTETPFDVMERECLQCCCKIYKPTLIISLGDPIHIDLLNKTRNQWPEEVEWKPFIIFDHFDQANLDLFRTTVIDAVEEMERHQRSHPENSCIFVHCYMGISRSASVMILYLVKNRGMTVRKAIEFLRQCRPCIYPNFGFLRELLAIEDSIDGFF